MKQDSSGLIRHVDDELAAFFDDRERAFVLIGEDLVPVVEAARRFVLDGGKRLRPLFAYWGWRSAGVGDGYSPGLISAAASLELLHACALVHDDVMDASETRRGRAAAHAAFAERHRAAGWSGDAAVFGTAAAIVLGDLLLAWSDSMFASATIGAAERLGARGVYDEMRQLVMAGQYLDVLVQARGAFSIDEALRVIEYKTSKYTVEGPLHLGAAVAGAPAVVFEALSAYGLALGEAFQLRDDVLGVFGDPALTGKPAGDDLREGKHTLLTALAMRSAGPTQTNLLQRGLGDRALDADRVAALQEVIVSTGALERVEHRITERAAEASRALETDALDPAARVALGELVGSATRRHS
ncbi:MAG: polyprenyl synthetase family protein [Jatrophihabitans sp.]